MSTTATLARAGLIVSGAFFVSRVLGWLRLVVIANQLPDPSELDAFFAAFRIPDLLIAQRGVPKGDRRCAAIAAASIVAKVTRDREMLRQDATDPRYGYAHHKGYATAEHLAAVARYGYSALHRRSFKPQSSLFDTMEFPPPAEFE